VLAAICAAGATGTYLVAFHTAFGLTHDALLFSRASGYPVVPVRAAGARALASVDIGSVLLAVAILVVLGVVRRSSGRAVAAALVVLLSIGSVEAIKHTLQRGTAARPVTWPSGHAAVAASLGLALVLAVPGVLRPVAAVTGAGYTAGIGLAVVILGWHYPSDVVGAYFICGFWACVAAIVLPGAPGRAAINARGVVYALFGVAVASFVAAALAKAHPAAVEATRASRSVVAVGGVLGLLAITLFAAFAPLAAERDG
jgi:membrane-associated phospholipid phosphatase